MLYVHDNATLRFGRLVHCAGALVTLGSAIGAYLVFYAPTMKATESTNHKIAALEQALQRAPAIQREHDQLSQRLRAMEEQVRAIHRRVPEEAQDSEFLSSLTRLAEKVGLVITDLVPSTPQNKAGYSQLDIAVTGQASYESLCQFLDGIGRFQRLVKVLALDVRHDRTGEGRYPVVMTVAIYFGAHGEAAGEERR